MRSIRTLVTAALLATAMLATAAPAEAYSTVYFAEVYDPAYSLTVGKPCTLQTWTYVDTDKIPPVRFVSSHRCSV